MAQRPTPRPFRGECPFCNARLVSEASSCSSCTRIFNAEDISIIREIIDLDSRLRDPESAHELIAKVQQQKLLAAEEAQRVEIERAKVRAVEEEKKLSESAEARAQQIAQLESMPKWKKLLYSTSGKVVVSSLLIALLISLVVLANSQKSLDSAQVDSMPTQSSDPSALESPTAVSEVELKILEDQALGELREAEVNFCNRLDDYSLKSLKSFERDTPEFLELEDLYTAVGIIVVKYNFETGKQIPNALDPGWNSWGFYVGSPTEGAYQVFVDSGAEMMKQYCNSLTP